jgi:hypothetical protein
MTLPPTVIARGGSPEAISGREIPRDKGETLNPKHRTSNKSQKSKVKNQNDKSKVKT